MNLVHQQAVTSSIGTSVTGIFYFKKRKVDLVHVTKAHTEITGTAPLLNTPVSTEAGWAPELFSTC